MINKYNKYTIALIASLLPVVTFADDSVNGTDLTSLAGKIVTILNLVLVLMIGFSIVSFTWYVIKYYVMPNENRTEGNTYIMWSLIGFFVIFSLFGLVNILVNSFGLGDSSMGSWATFTSIFPS